MRNPKDSFCSHCGGELARSHRYPRKCPRQSCSADIYANPIPVVLLLLPVWCEKRLGLLVVRRAIEPKVGKLALVGGFLEEHETWQQGAAREASEEAGVSVPPSSLVPYSFASSDPRPNRILLFARGQPLPSSELPPFVQNPEVSERGLIFGTHGLAPHFAFPLHLQASGRFFDETGHNGPHDFRPF